MHWALGENEMARRAHECNPHSERSGSFKEATETSAVSTYNAASTHQFEDHRAHYFNVTRPPQVRLPMPVSPQPSKAAELALIQKALDVEQECVASSITGKDEKANHAVEEKGQVNPIIRKQGGYRIVNSLRVDAGTSCKRRLTVEDDCSRQPSKSTGESQTIDISIPPSVYQSVSSI